MTYRPKLFRLPDAPAPGTPPYLAEEKALVAVDVALATGRPLLIEGAPGCGKSTLAAAVAAGNGWRFISQTITSQTRLDHLFAEFDTLERLNHAQLGQAGHGLLPDWCYLKPGTLWWAFDRESAAMRGATSEQVAALNAQLASGPQHAPSPPEDPAVLNLNSETVVVLLDEIDKADPDLPNDLLEPLDVKRFRHPLQGHPPIKAQSDLKMLVAITTNGERSLPPAFLRRCVVLGLASPDVSRLVEIALAHFGEDEKGDQALYTEIATELSRLQEEAERNGLRLPSTAEFLDAVVAVREIAEMKGEAVWPMVRDVLLIKSNDWE